MRWRRTLATKIDTNVEQRLDETEKQIIDMQTRLLRLEAEIGIYKPPVLKGDA